MGIVRTTFIIDEQGKVLDVIEKVKVKTQIEELKTFWVTYMKVVGLNRMREVETELQQSFSDLDFKFYKKHQKYLRATWLI